MSCRSIHHIRHQPLHFSDSKNARRQAVRKRVGIEGDFKEKAIYFRIIRIWIVKNSGKRRPHGRVSLLIHSAASGYDAILLDVDNGPESLTRRRSDILYSPAGLQASRKTLRSGGMLAVWSADGDGDFTQRLEQADFDVTEVKVSAFPADADQTIDGPCVNHHIWFARKR